MSFVLWSLLFGGVAVSVAGRTPPILYFDVLLIAWLGYQIWVRHFWPNFSDSNMLWLATFCFLTMDLSTFVNYRDPLKSLMAMKIFAFGILVYVCARAKKPTLVAFSSFGCLLGVYITANIVLYWRDLAENGMGSLKYEITTPMGTANLVAALLGMTFPISVAGFLIEKGWKRWFHFAGIWISGIGIAVSASRGVILALLLCSATCLHLMFRAGLRVKHIAIGAVLASLFLFLLPTYIFNENAELVQNRIDNPDDQRMEIYTMCWNLFRDHPLLGVGPGQIVDYTTSLQADKSRGFNAHDLVLNSLLDTGIIGTVPFLFLLAIVLWRAWKFARLRPNPLTIAIFVSLASALLADMVEGSFVVQQFQVVFWMIAALVPIQITS